MTPPDESATARTGPAPLEFMRRGMPLLRVASSVVLIYLVLRQASLTDMLRIGGEVPAHWPLLLVALVQPGIAMTVTALRWRTLLGGIGIRPNLIDLIRAILVGSFFNSFLPSTVGGDVARSWWIRRTVGSGALSLTVVVLDRLIGTVGICTIGLVAAALQPSLVADVPQLWLSVLIVGAAAVSVAALGSAGAVAAGRRLFTLPVLRSFQTTAKTAYAGFASLRRDKGRLFRAFLLSLTLQGLIIIQFFVLASALALDVSLWHMAILIPVVTLVTLLPITINGIGLREASLAVLGAGFGLGVEHAVALAWLFLAFQYLYAVFGGLVYMAGRPKVD